MDSLEKTAQLLKYACPPKVAKGVREVKEQFPSFAHEVASYDLEKLISLSGQLSVSKTEIPIQIFLPLSFPHQPPVLSLLINDTTLLNPAGDINKKGKVKNAYLKKWNKNSTLVQLLISVIRNFESTFPAFDLSHFDLPSKARDNILQVLEKHPNLKLSWATYADDDGTEPSELSLAGILEVDDKPGVLIRVLLLRSFPQTAPVIYVIPQGNTKLKSTFILYRSGKVKHPYIKRWEYRRSNLCELLQNLALEFSVNYPIQDMIGDSKESQTALPDKDKYWGIFHWKVYGYKKNVASPDLEEVKEFVKVAGLSHQTEKALIKKGFTTKKAIHCMQVDDLHQLHLPLAEFCILRETLQIKRQASEMAYCKMGPEANPEQDCSSENLIKEKENHGHRTAHQCDNVFARAMQNLLSHVMVSNQQITIQEEIGRGEFGVVFKGELRLKENSPPEDVAVKTAFCNASSDLSAEDFCQEILQLLMIKHKNIVCLKALAMLDGKPFMVLPFMANGDLKSYISNPERALTVEDLLEMALDVARGMQYLAEQNIIHADLAARNCLVDADKTVKVGDFGLARKLHFSDYYKMDLVKNRPVRWMAPESLLKMIYTLKSDVWSFGVLLWELMTRGQRPYPEISDTLLLPGKIKNGYRMACPPYTPDEIYQVMAVCWQEDEDERPDFSTIINWLETLLSGEDEQSDDEESPAAISASAAKPSTDASTPPIVRDRRTRPTPLRPPRPSIHPDRGQGQRDVDAEDDSNPGIIRPQSDCTPSSGSARFSPNSRHTTG